VKEPVPRYTFGPTWRFSPRIYNKDILESRLRELAYLNRKIRIVLTDEREIDEAGKIYEKVFYSEGGIIEFVEMLDQNGKRTPDPESGLYGRP